MGKACAQETLCVILNELGDRKFVVLIDESRDASIKKQMAVVLRFVNQTGHVIERFLGIVHVSDTAATSLKVALEGLFARHCLSISRLRGKRYDGASKMRGEFNGLQKKVLQENPHAFYIHCFAHQLQLVVVVVAKCNSYVADFVNYTTSIVNTVGASCKRRDQLLPVHHDKILLELENGNIVRGRGKHQETSIVRPGDTRWGSHYTTLVRLFIIWDSVLTVLENVNDDATNLAQKTTAIEMNARFSEASTNLLKCISSLEPKDSFSKFDSKKLLELANIYYVDFSLADRTFLRNELRTYITNVRNSSNFSDCDDLATLAILMVQTGRHVCYPLVYCLIELTLILPVATTTVERTFSAMKIIKTELRNKMADDWMNDSMICYIEREIFAAIDDERILQRFQSINNRKYQTPQVSI